MRYFMLVCVTLMVASLATGSPLSNDQSERAKKVVLSDLNGQPIDIYENSYLNENNDGDLLAYEPVANRRLKYQASQTRAGDNQIKPSLNLERESLSSAANNENKQQVKVGASLADEMPDSPNADRFGSIAFNSREVRFVGPNQKEVEMKDDVASKVVAVMDNLQKEATEVWDDVNEKLDKGWKDIKRSEVWGQVNDKLDKGWTDLKTMVEGVISPSVKRQP